MESKIIKSKHIKDGVVELFEFSCIPNGVINYLIVKVYICVNVVGHGKAHGVAKIEEASCSSKEAAMNFFNNQN
jgi:hypothetical protein